MRTIIFFIFIITTTSISADWVKYHTTENGDEFFFDNEQLKTFNDTKTVWIRVRYRTSIMGAYSYHHQMQIHCSSRGYVILQSRFFNDRNWSSPATATDNQKRPRASLTPGSIEERLAVEVCYN